MPDAADVASKPCIGVSYRTGPFTYAYAHRRAGHTRASIQTSRPRWPTDRCSCVAVFFATRHSATSGRSDLAVATGAALMVDGTGCRGEPRDGCVPPRRFRRLGSRGHRRCGCTRPRTSRHGRHTPPGHHRARSYAAGRPTSQESAGLPATTVARTVARPGAAQTARRGGAFRGCGLHHGRSTTTARRAGRRPAILRWMARGPREPTESCIRRRRSPISAAGIAIARCICGTMGCPPRLCQTRHTIYTSGGLRD